MSRNDPPRPGQIERSKAARDKSRNERQAAVFLTELSRHACEDRAQELCEISKKTVEQSKKICQKARELRNSRKAG
jgi:hypothetical protein